ncbi:hypothetical protein C0J52_03702 [Blattella germanica]|nr:hypothetical protein C0J52_03702 [Blattella germanica]
MKEVLILLLLMYGASVQSQSTFPPATCRYWCQISTYPATYYCCPDGGIKPGSCPTITTCTEESVTGCTSDNGCPETQKCCYSPCYCFNVCLPIAEPR